MPPVVSESMDELLQALETELETNVPDTFQGLQPGLNSEELKQAEAMLGQSIHPEMQALYRWHNGLANDKELFPGHGFWSLQDAIETNRELNAQYQESGTGILMQGEESWLVLFPDPAGDGYYYDPVVNYETGGIFYNFREIGYFRYFPSIKNLLKAIVECYRQGAYQGSEPDFELEEQIMNQYGLEVAE